MITLKWAGQPSLFAKYETRNNNCCEGLFSLNVESDSKSQHI
jgi:hypothetical protein